MLLKLNATTAAIRGQISLKIRQAMHFEHFVIFTLTCEHIRNW